MALMHIYSPQEKEQYPCQKNKDYDESIQKHCLGGMPDPILMKSPAKKVDFLGFSGEELLLSNKYVGVRQVYRRQWRHLGYFLIWLPFKDCHAYPQKPLSF